MRATADPVATPEQKLLGALAEIEHRHPGAVRYGDGRRLVSRDFARRARRARTRQLRASRRREVTIFLAGTGVWVRFDPAEMHPEDGGGFAILTDLDDDDDEFVDEVCEELFEHPLVRAIPLFSPWHARAVSTVRRVLRVVRPAREAEHSRPREHRSPAHQRRGPPDDDDPAHDLRLSRAFPA
jgi:hypothetical protein